MTNRNYPAPTVDPEWASSRWTDMAVATAIHALADSKRSPHDIWEAPTPAEYDHVVMAVSEYVEHGVFDHEPDGYYWGQSIVHIDA